MIKQFTLARATDFVCAAARCVRAVRRSARAAARGPASLSLLTSCLSKSLMLYNYLSIAPAEVEPPPSLIPLVSSLLQLVVPNVLVTF